MGVLSNYEDSYLIRNIVIIEPWINCCLGIDSIRGLSAYENPASKEDSKSSYTMFLWRIEEATTKRISMDIGECNNHWKLVLRNVSCSDINVEHNWNQSLGIQVGISGNLLFILLSNLINWTLFDDWLMLVELRIGCYCFH